MAVPGAPGALQTNGARSPAETLWPRWQACRNKARGLPGGWKPDLGNFLLNGPGAKVAAKIGTVQFPTVPG
jgi:hypothetical protein